MITLAFFLFGILCGIGLGLLLARIGVAYKTWPYALLLVAAAVVYPLLTLTSSQAFGSTESLLSWGGLIGFGLAAAAGMRWSPWWIAVGLLLHAGFDLGLTATSLPVCSGLLCSANYGPWCAGLDLIVGVLFVFRVCITPEPRLSR